MSACFVLVTLASSLLVQVTSPPAPERRKVSLAAPERVVSTSAVHALVIKSWFPGPGMADSWDELNIEWPSYGSVPIVVEEGPDSFTYEDLVAAGPDVLILSDPAGGIQQFSAPEIEAVRRYAEDGHGLVGTFLTFFWDTTQNQDLAPLFGFADGIDFDGPKGAAPPISNTFRVVQASRLFRNVTFAADGLRGPRWHSDGYPFTQTPAGRWIGPVLGSAQVVAQCDGFLAVVTVYEAPAYAAVYFSNMPEYFGNATDKQLLYNAIVYKGQ